MKQQGDPNPAAHADSQTQHKVLKEHATCKEPKFNMYKSKQSVDELEKCLLVTNAPQQQAVTQLAALRSQLHTAQVKNRCHRSCLYQCEKQTLEMKLELVQNKCKAQAAPISKKEDVSNDQILKMQQEVLREKEQKLIEFGKEIELLNLVEEEFQTQVLDWKDEVQTLEEQACFSVHGQLQEVQNKIKHHACEAYQLREQLAQERWANKKLEARRDMYYKDACQTRRTTGPAHQSIPERTVLRQLLVPQRSVPSSPVKQHRMIAMPCTSSLTSVFRAKSANTLGL